MELFIKKFKEDLESALEERYLPKITDSHLSHLVLFHLLNAATVYNVPVQTLSIRETAKRVYFININQQTDTAITLNLNAKMSCTTSH